MVWFSEGVVGYPSSRGNNKIKNILELFRNYLNGKKSQCVEGNQNNLLFRQEMPQYDKSHYSHGFWIGLVRSPSQFSDLLNFFQNLIFILIFLRVPVTNKKYNEMPEQVEFQNTVIFQPVVLTLFKSLWTYSLKIKIIFNHMKFDCPLFKYLHTTIRNF